jgi:hypothetical protein
MATCCYKIGLDISNVYHKTCYCSPWLGFVIMKICLSLAFIEVSIGYRTRTALKSHIITLLRSDQ